MFIAFDRIKILADKQGISINKLEENLGYGTNTLYRLKRSNPSSKTTKEIADYFNVSTDYLLGRTDNPNIARDSYVAPSGQIVTLEELADGVLMFDGKPVSDEDKLTIQAIIKGYLDSRPK